jgi:hypothetical protein
MGHRFDFDNGVSTKDFKRRIPFAEQTLNKFSVVEAAIPFAELPGKKILWIHDFIGETQGQYDPKRLSIMNQLLAILPEWLKGHFAKSPLAELVPALLIIITILELAAGVLNGIGCFAVVLLRDSTIAFYGAVISAIAIIALFFGQRMAKDYAGAAVLVSYFLLALVAIYLLAQR